MYKRQEQVQDEPLRAMMVMILITEGKPMSLWTIRYITNVEYKLHSMSGDSVCHTSVINCAVWKTNRRHIKHICNANGFHQRTLMILYCIYLNYCNKVYYALCGSCMRGAL